MTGWEIAFVGVVGVLFGFLLSSIAAASGAASREKEFSAELAAARAGKVKLYDWSEEENEVRDDALIFAERMTAELASEVGALRAAAYAAVAWLESSKTRTADGDQVVANLRAVLEDVEALEEAR